MARAPAQAPSPRKGFSCTTALLPHYIKPFGVNQGTLKPTKEATSNSPTKRWRAQVIGFISSNSTPICETGLMRFEHATPARSGEAVLLSLAHQGLVWRSTYYLHLTDITSRYNHLSPLLPGLPAFQGGKNVLLLWDGALSLREGSYLLHVLR